MAFAILLLAATALFAATSSEAQDPSKLSLSYYSKTCPTAQDIVRAEMDCAVKANPRNAAFAIRIHFHDCFVQGCDGSVLLDDTATLIGEKNADQNVNSLQGFELVDKIKEKLEAACPGVVSCADILAIAARDATMLVGGPYWDVPVGRLDSKSASVDQANTDIPTPKQGLPTLITKFLEKGLSVTDMVALVGAHTVGMSRCTNFRDRLYGGDFQFTSSKAVDAGSSKLYLDKLKEVCPAEGGDDKVSPMDYHSPTLFDNTFFQTLVSGVGLLNSDQEMYSSLLAFETARIVDKYWADPASFFKDFANSMVKMGNITNPEGGEVRKTCRFINT